MRDNENLGRPKLCATSTGSIIGYRDTQIQSKLKVFRAIGLGGAIEIFLRIGDTPEKTKIKIRTNVNSR